jgi:hypothetical protein
MSGRRPCGWALGHTGRAHWRGWGRRMGVGVVGAVESPGPGGAWAGGDCRPLIGRHGEGVGRPWHITWAATRLSGGRRCGPFPILVPQAAVHPRRHRIRPALVWRSPQHSCFPPSLRFPHSPQLLFRGKGGWGDELKPSPHMIASLPPLQPSAQSVQRGN